MTAPHPAPTIGIVRRGPWTVLSEALVHETPWLRLQRYNVLNPKGDPAVYTVVSFKNLAIGVLPVFPDGTVPLVGQHRFPLDLYSWELPEGGGDPAVPPMESAARELREETGLEAARYREILRFHTSNSITDELAICFLATGLTEGQPDPDDDEDLAQDRKHFLDVLDDVAAGRITDSLTVVMILRAHHMAVTGALEPDVARALLNRPRADAPGDAP